MDKQRSYLIERDPIYTNKVQKQIAFVGTSSVLSLEQIYVGWPKNWWLKNFLKIHLSEDKTYRL